MEVVASGHVTAHDKLLPSRGTLALLFCPHETNRFSSGQESKRNARALVQFHAVCKNLVNFKWSKKKRLIM